MRTKVMTDFPFSDCSECEMLEADMNIEKIYSDVYVLNSITVFCRKGNLCRRIWEKLTEKKEAESDGTEQR